MQRNSTFIRVLNDRELTTSLVFIIEGFGWENLEIIICKSYLDFLVDSHSLSNFEHYKMIQKDEIPSKGSLCMVMPVAEFNDECFLVSSLWCS